LSGRLRESRTVLLRRLAGTPARLSRAAAAARRAAIASDGWTVQQVVLHLVAVEEVVFQRRLDDLAGQDDPHWDWVEPGPADATPGETLSESAARFAAVRRETLTRIGRLDEAGWLHSGWHATQGRLDVHGLLTLAADHDADHLDGLLMLGRLGRSAAHLVVPVPG
jgi:uncharacterized damage-inducible protein DinB